MGLFLLLFAAPSHADQCAWISRQTAKEAATLILTSEKMAKLCEPCGEVHTEIVTVHKAEARPTQDKFWEVVVDGTPVDLAYTFVEVDGKMKNVAKLVSCPAVDVSEELPKKALEPLPPPIAPGKVPLEVGE
jgi:hypothetical protein